MSAAVCHIIIGNIVIKSFARIACFNPFTYSANRKIQSLERMHLLLGVCIHFNDYLGRKGVYGQAVSDYYTTTFDCCKLPHSAVICDIV